MTTLSMAKLSSYASPSRLVQIRTANGVFASSVTKHPIARKRSSLNTPPHSCMPDVPTKPALLQHISPFTDTYASSLSLSVKCTTRYRDGIFFVWLFVCYEYRYRARLPEHHSQYTYIHTYHIYHTRIHTYHIYHTRFSHNHIYTHKHTRTHVHTHTHTHTHQNQAHLHKPRINFEEVELHRVCARRQVERLRDVGPFALDTVTSTNFPEIAACGNPPAVPTVELLLAIKR